jgi:uncharacterized membrane protein
MSINVAMDQLRTLLRAQPQPGEVRNVNQLHDESLSLGQRIADGVARNMGSWRFIIVQSAILLVWITLNAIYAAHEAALFGFNVRAWDPYPFILLNLALSFQAAYAAPFIMMSQNRQADKDRLAAEHDYCVNIRAEATVRAVLEHLKAQDDVILAIVRQMQRSSGLKPTAEQVQAEARLREVAEGEAEMLARTIREEQAEAGLAPEAAGAR